MIRKYYEQYQRMIRCFDHLAPVVSAYYVGQGPTTWDNELDLAYSFFMNAYHLKDWIKHDINVPASARNAVESHVNATRALRLCADICNGFKHLTLTTTRSGENPTLRAGLSDGPAFKYLWFAVETDSGGTSVGELAADSIAAWQSFLLGNALLSQSECKSYSPPTMRLPRYL